MWKKLILMLISNPPPNKGLDVGTESPRAIKCEQRVAPRWCTFSCQPGWSREDSVLILHPADTPHQKGKSQWWGSALVAMTKREMSCVKYSCICRRCKLSEVRSSPVYLTCEEATEETESQSACQTRTQESPWLPLPKSHQPVYFSVAAEVPGQRIEGQNQVCVVLPRHPA